MIRNVLGEIDDFIYYEMIHSRHMILRMLGSMCYLIGVMIGVALAITMLMLPIIHPMLGFVTVFVLLALLTTEVFGK